jgi:hypothetical protein
MNQSINQSTPSIWFVASHERSLLKGKDELNPAYSIVFF